MNELVSELVAKLDVREQQAKGGAGLILGLAEQHLGAEFRKVAGAVPGIRDLISSAPPAESAGARPGNGPQPGQAPQGAELSQGERAVEGGGAGGIGGVPGAGGITGGIAGGMGGIMAELGGLGGRAQAVAAISQLAGGFSGLGLDASMIGRFVSVITEFVRRKGGDDAARRLEQAVQHEQR